MNPKIYFKIQDNTLVPIKKQNPILDSLFMSKAILTKNKNRYNNYTINVIKENSGSMDIFKSENYSWDSDANIFNFNNLEKISDDEYFTAVSFITEFNPTQNYEFPVQRNIDIKELKENIKNISIDATSTNILDIIKSSYPRPSISESGMYVDEFTWNYLVRNILRKKNTMLVGPTGTGKTELVMMIAEKLGIPRHVYDMGSMQDPLTDLLGSHRLENGSSIFDYAKFTQDVQEPCIIVLDELSRAPLMANNILFPCLDRRRELPVEIAGSKDIRNIKIHPECVFVATANIGVEYSGTNDIDAALFNRFLPLQLDYMQADHEIDVLTNRTGITKEQAIKIVNFANRIRKDYKDEILTKSCSTREVIAMGEMVADGFSYLEAFTSVIIHKYSNSKDDEVAHIQRLLISL